MNQRDCQLQGHGHNIPSGTEPMKMIGAKGFNCEIWFVEGSKFAISFEGCLAVVSHHKPEKLLEALKSTKLLRTAFYPKLEVLRVYLDEPGIPLRFYMTSRELKRCS